MKKHWSDQAVAYQIYPRSFKDSNGDGIGDLRGVIEKLDYIQDLGIDVIWICPFYKSPNADHGYDISDYQDVMAEFGTLADCDELLKEVHARGMKLIIDLVINHTSDEHAWFIESKESKESAKRDWYIWRDAKEGAEPNNWVSFFKGSIWEYDEESNQYYMHIFDKKQPDLNWENKEVRQALYDMVNWWLDKGIDGFRVDAISHIKKENINEDIDYSKPEIHYPNFDKFMNIDGIDAFLSELKEKTFNNYDIMTVGEANGVSAENAHQWAGKEDGYFNMIFQFEHLKLWDRAKNTLDLVKLKTVLAKWQTQLHGIGWNALYLENHDLTRVVSKWGNDVHYWQDSAKTLALMYFMQEGTPFIYQGQEIGMTNVRVDQVEEYQETPTILTYYENIEKGMSKEEALEISYRTTRANSRTPMQWDDSYCAGFSSGKPWMKLNENYVDINVAKQINDENSILSFYKKLISIRKNESKLLYAKFELLCPMHKQIFAYERIHENQSYLIVCNVSAAPATFDYGIQMNGEVLIHTHTTEILAQTCIQLKPYESFMIKLTK